MKHSYAQERHFQSALIRELKKRFAGCIVTKLDSSHIQGIPDLLILWGKHWATLECKKNAKAKHQPIQAGAISESLLSQILRFADQDQVRAYATPRAMNVMSPGKQARAKSMRSSGYTTSQIAAALGVSTSTVSNYLKGE